MEKHGINLYFSMYCMMFSCNFQNYTVSIELFSANIAFWDIPQTYGINFSDRTPEIRLSAARKCHGSSKPKINKPIPQILKDKQK